MFSNVLHIYTYTYIHTVKILITLPWGKKLTYHIDSVIRGTVLINVPSKNILYQTLPLKKPISL